MTLLVAWRDEHTVHLAADSRLNFSASTPACADVGAKVVTLEIRIHGPSPAGEPPTWVQSRRLGLAVAGSLTTAAVLQATLASLLTSLSSATGSIIDMGILVDIIEAVFQRVSQSVCAAIFEKGLGELIVCGYCDTARRARAFLLEINATGYPIKTTATEVLTTTNVEYRGSGRKTAIAVAQSEVDPLNVLKRVILDPHVPTVGGAVQYGRIDGVDFRLYLVRDYEADHATKTMTAAFCIHGLPVYGTVNLTLPAGYAVTGRAIDPFTAEIDALLSQRYQVL